MYFSILLGIQVISISLSLLIENKIYKGDYHGLSDYGK